MYTFKPFCIEILPLRCLGSCLKHHASLFCIIFCSIISSVIRCHIFVLGNFLITWVIRKKDNTCSVLPKFLFLTDSPRHEGESPALYIAECNSVKEKVEIGLSMASLFLSLHIQRPTSSWFCLIYCMHNLAELTDEALPPVW